ncbi:MAG: PilZ domain-containing protein [Magnetococcales bacterium]|nr:PilZ domain-containing protein [Magnetococcales bacterium]
MTLERRTALRIPWSIRVTLHFANGFIHNVPVVDLSLSGIRLELSDLSALPLDPTASLQIFFACDALPPPHGCLLQLPCHIVWSNPQELGLQFLFADESLQQQLSALIDTSLATPAQ